MSLFFKIIDIEFLDSKIEIWRFIVRIIILDCLLNILLTLLFMIKKSNIPIRNVNDLFYIFFTESRESINNCCFYNNQANDVKKPNIPSDIENIVNNKKNFYICKMYDRNKLLMILFIIPGLNTLKFIMILCSFYYWRLDKLIKYDSNFIDEMMQYFISEIKEKSQNSQIKNDIYGILKLAMNIDISFSDIIRAICIYFDKPYFKYKDKNFYIQNKSNDIYNHLIKIQKKGKIKDKDKELFDTLLFFLKFQSSVDMDSRFHTLLEYANVIMCVLVIIIIYCCVSYYFLIKFFHYLKIVIFNLLNNYYFNH